MSNSIPGTKVPRRIVSGIQNGKSVLVSDGLVPNAHVYQSTPSFMEPRLSTFSQPLGVCIDGRL